MEDMIDISFTDDDFEAVSHYLDEIEAAKPLDDYALFVSSATMPNIDHMFPNVSLIPSVEPILPVFEGI